jgi:hypothetical protein
MKLNRQFSKEVQMANKHMKHNIFIHQGNVPQNDSEISSHASQKDYQENKQRMLVRTWGKKPLLHCLRECKLARSLWKPGCRCLKKVKIEQK